MLTRRKFLSDGWKWTGLIFVPTLLRAQFLPHRRRTFGGAGAGGGIVTFDSTFEKGSLSATSPFSFVSNVSPPPGTAGSVGSNSNRLLIGFVSFKASTPTAVAMTWNSVAMTEIGMNSFSAQPYDAYLFGLIAPATGAQTLSVSWTGGAVIIVSGAISLYNVAQGTAWQNFAADTGVGTSASSTITSADGNMAVIGHTNDNASTTTIAAGTQAWKDESTDGNYAMAYRASTSASTVITYTLGTSKDWCNLKVDAIKA